MRTRADLLRDIGLHEATLSSSKNIKSGPHKINVTESLNNARRELMEMEKRNKL